MTPRGVLDHVGIAVADLDAATAPYLALGAHVLEDERVEDQGVQVRILTGGPVLIELLAPLPGDGPLARFLRRRGPGLHHLAFRVADIEAELARLTAAGARAIDRRPRPGRAGSQVAFLHPSFAHGVLLELVQPAGAQP